jgi:hypothetical protein
VSIGLSETSTGFHLLRFAFVFGAVVFLVALAKVGQGTTIGGAEIVAAAGAAPGLAIGIIFGMAAPSLIITALGCSVVLLDAIVRAICEMSGD